ncbi:hypothetical protein BV20DRAFT_866923 [Pilatotrama ljubarskyi]|nr:hypothetical protein BV20DRAFT_866923 [Pilatotrama ljubarskyi]
MYPANPVFVQNTNSEITYNDPSLAHQDSQLTAGASALIGQINNTYDGGQLAVTTTPGMSLELIFYGRIIQLYGAALPWPTGQQPRAEYTIDGDPEFNLVPSLPSPESNISFYASALLPINFHTLTVTVLNATRDAPFLFDYIVYGFLDTSEDPNPPNASSTTGSTSLPSDPTNTISQSSLIDSLPATTGPASGQPSVSSYPTTSTAHSPGLSAHLIIGVALSCTCFFVVTVTLFCWGRRLRLRHRQADRESIEPAEPVEDQPAEDTVEPVEGDVRGPLWATHDFPADVGRQYQRTSPLGEKSAYSPTPLPQEDVSGLPATSGPSSAQLGSAATPGPASLGRASSPLSGTMSFDGKEMRLTSPAPRPSGPHASDANGEGISCGEAGDAMLPSGGGVTEGAPPPYEP